MGFAAHFRDGVPSWRRVVNQGGWRAQSSQLKQRKSSRHRLLIDKNSLWGGSNITKRQLCVKGILAQDFGLFGDLFREGSADFRGRGGEGAFSTIWRGSSGVFEAHPGTPALPPRIPDLYGWRQRLRNIRVIIEGDNYQEKA